MVHSSVMINEIIKDINEAEKEALQILEAAKVKVSAIEKQNQIDIETLTVESDAAVAQLINKQLEELRAGHTSECFGEVITVSKSKQDAAKKYIVDEFYKRYMRGHK